MKIVRLTATGVEPVKAQAYYNNKKDTLYFNIKHGSVGENFGYWLGRISPKIKQPDDISDILVLDMNNYVFVPKRTETGVLKDKLGNTVYSIGIDFSSLHQRDIVIFWEIPNRNYSNVKFKTSGECEVIGTGYNGKDRGDIVYKSPAPIIEVVGNCELSWSGVDSDGNSIEQNILYDYTNGKWDIKPLQIIKPDKKGTGDDKEDTSY